MLEMFHDFKIFLKLSQPNCLPNITVREIFSSIKAVKKHIAMFLLHCKETVWNTGKQRSNQKKKNLKKQKGYIIFFFSVQPRLNAELKTKLTSGKQKANLVNRNKPKNNANTVTWARDESLSITLPFGIEIWSPIL